MDSIHPTVNTGGFLDPFTLDHKEKKITYTANSKHITEPMKKKDLAVTVIAIWLMIVSIFMLLAYQVDLEIFFVLWLIGLLVIVELMDTRFSLPPYMRYLKYVVAAGILLFGGIVAGKVLEILHG
jgi:hypothetical protein